MWTIFAVGLSSVLGAGPKVAPPAVDVALTELCAAHLAPADLCLTWIQCDVGRRATCEGNDQATQPETEDWSAWSCEVDRRNGYLTCTTTTHVRSGPGDGDSFKASFDVALFVGKTSVVVGLASHGDRPTASFFSRQDQTWAASTAMPVLTAKSFALPEPGKAPPNSAQQGFRPEFFVELTLPRVGTTVSAEGRWVNTYRDDSGYGQPGDTLLTSASRDLNWNAAKSTFVLQR